MDGDQSKVAPVVLLDMRTSVFAPLHIVVGESITVAAGTGFTVTTSVKTVPEQPFAEGVMVYVILVFANPVL